MATVLTPHRDLFRPRALTCLPRLRTLCAIAAVAALAACASTRIQRSWVRADLGPLNFHQVVSIAGTRSPETRRAMEDSMAS